MRAGDVDALSEGGDGEPPVPAELGDVAAAQRFVQLYSLPPAVSA